MLHGHKLLFFHVIDCSSSQILGEKKEDWVLHLCWLLCHAHSFVLKPWQLWAFSWPWLSRSVNADLFVDRTTVLYSKDTHVVRWPLCGWEWVWTSDEGVWCHPWCFCKAESRQLSAGSMGPSAQLGPLGKQGRRKIAAGQEKRCTGAVSVSATLLERFREK